VERETGYLGFGLLEILRNHLVGNDITRNSLIDYLSGNISANIFTPSLFLPGTNMPRLKYEIVS